MQIVIKLAEEDYNDITLTGENTINLGVLLALRQAVRNGIPLPEHHGRLIDEQQIIDRFKPVEKFEYWRIGLDGLINVLSDAPTIIEGSNKE